MWWSGGGDLDPPRWIGRWWCTRWRDASDPVHLLVAMTVTFDLGAASAIFKSGIFDCSSSRRTHRTTQTLGEVTDHLKPRRTPAGVPYADRELKEEEDGTALEDPEAEEENLKVEEEEDASMNGCTLIL